jgi:thiol-disulfide isomerase/thioredoxin
MHQLFRTISKIIRRTALLCLALPLATQASLAQGGGRIIYPDPSLARPQLRQALARARAGHKRVIVDFGGNWCGDCQVLDLYFHDPANQPLLEQNFEVVDVNIGRYDVNQDIAEQYGIPLKLGVPALVVLSPTGKVLYAQTHGEFEKMRKLQPSDITAFLNEWKPSAHSGAKAGR